MAIVYDIDGKSVGSIVKAFSMVETIIIVVPVIMSIWISTFETVLIPRTVAVIIDLPMIGYVNHKLTASAGAATTTHMVYLY